ncbi:MAG: metal-dependent transcriptional regulator [Anaerolineales bacterium]|nr:metal-dependent transcriptional regulator [Anaerolineales bacterium]
MEDSRPTPTIEDYLSLFLILQRDNEPIVGARLAELLNVSPPTVTNTLQRMARDGLITQNDPKGAALTDKGLHAARSVMRRHMLSEWMVARMVGWSKSHVQAHEMEHVISAELEAALIQDLNNPQTCPHGNPLPGYEQVVKNWIPLTELNQGDEIIIRRVHELAEDAPGVLPFLEEKQVLPGVHATVTEVLPFNETVTLKLEKGQLVTIGFGVARYIYGEPA